MSTAGTRGALAGLAVSLCLSACQERAASYAPAAAPNVVRIVSSFPHKGPYAAQSRGMEEAIDLAIEQKRRPGNRWVVEHIVLDGGAGESGGWSSEREAANAEEAAADSAVVACIGPYNSGAAAISLPITNRAGLLQLSPTTSWPGLTMQGWDPGEPQRYYPAGPRTFARLMPPDSMQGSAAVRWAAELGARSVYAVDDGSSYSAGLASAFMAAAHHLGLRAAGRSVLGVDPQGLAARVSASRADALFYAPSTVAQAVQAARALSTIRLAAGVFASDTALSDQFIEQAGDEASNWHVVFNGVPSPGSSPDWQRFASRFAARYGSVPTQFAGNAFDLATLVVDAVEGGAGRDRAKVVNQVTHTANYAGVAGAITFDSRGDVSDWRMTGYRLRDGKFALDRQLKSTP